MMRWLPLTRTTTKPLRLQRLDDRCAGDEGTGGMSGDVDRECQLHGRTELGDQPRQCFPQIRGSGLGRSALAVRPYLPVSWSMSVAF